MHTILTVIQVFLSVALIGLVLIQHGRGADAGAAFGSGASATVFGARGSGSFLTRATGIIATLFFLTSMAMAYYAAKGSKPAGLMDGAAGTQIKVQVPPQKAAAKGEAPVKIEVPSPSGVPTVPGATAKTAPSDVPAVPGSASGSASAPSPAGDVPAAPVGGPPTDAAPKPAPAN